MAQEPTQIHNIIEKTIDVKAGALYGMSSLDPAPAPLPAPETTTHLSVLSYTPKIASGNCVCGLVVITVTFPHSGYFGCCAGLFVAVCPCFLQPKPDYIAKTVGRGAV